MLHIGRKWPVLSRVVLVTIALLPATSHAGEFPWVGPTSIFFMQSGIAPSAETIRAQAQRMREYRALLADPDSNVRLAALDEMLKSGEAALRQMAFDAGFASADASMRALALRARILSMSGFVLEIQNLDNLNDEELKKVRSRFSPSFEIESVDAQTGNVNIRFTGEGRVVGQEFSFGVPGGGVRLRLSDGGVMIGTYSRLGQTVSVKLVLQ